VHTELPTLNLKLVIAGTGSQESVLKSLAASLKLEDKIEFRGYIQNKEVPACFNEMDIAVVSSLEESFGVSAVEAGACGLPVVATAVGGLPEVVLDGQTGLICKPAHPIDLAEKLKVLILDDQLRKNLGCNARDNILKKYDWHQNAALMMNYYQSIYDRDVNF